MLELVTLPNTSHPLSELSDRISGKITPAMDPLQKEKLLYSGSQTTDKVDVNKCILNLDGYSYMIVATAPERKTPDGEADLPAEKRPLSSKQAECSGPVQCDDLCTASVESRLEQGSLTILRRNNSSRRGQHPRLLSMISSSDQTDVTPVAGDEPDACGRAADRLRQLLQMLDKGEVSPEVIQNNIEYALAVLETFNLSERRYPIDDEDELSEVQQDAVPPEVREWLASTFTRQNTLHKKRAEGQPKFRTVANVIRMGIMVEKMTRRMSSSALLEVPAGVTVALQTIDTWSYDVFKLSEAGGGSALRFLGYDLIGRYGLFHKFKIPSAKLDAYLQTVEHGYGRFKNPYHNALHATDVTQTVHYIMSQMGLLRFLTDLEVLALLLAAIVHDIEHTGTTNNFHVNSSSDTALLYNDKSVLENHHVSTAFRILREEECNFLCNLTREEFMELRTLVIDMVLATDMSSHFIQVKSMKNYPINADTAVDKSKVLNLVLHCCDISHPSKEWSQHHRWTRLLLEEFFQQGDKEKELGLPISPLCDRASTLVPQSQIGFIEFIVEPSMSVCGELLERIATYLHTAGTGPTDGATNGLAHKTDKSRAGRVVFPWSCRPWDQCLAQNKVAWKRRQAEEEQDKNDAERETSESVAASPPHSPPRPASGQTTSASECSESLQSVQVT